MLTGGFVRSGTSQRIATVKFHEHGSCKRAKDPHLTNTKSQAAGSLVDTDHYTTIQELQFKKPPPGCCSDGKRLVRLPLRTVGSAWVTETVRPDSSGEVAQREYPSVALPQATITD